jgi:hypothetical protein
MILILRVIAGKNSTVNMVVEPSPPQWRGAALPMGHEYSEAYPSGSVR